MPFEIGASSSSDDRARAPAVHLRLLCTTDLHAHVLPYDYYTDQRSERVGLARTASLIRAAKKEAPNTLVLDNGDFLQGTPLGDYVAEHAPLCGSTVHPVIDAMNAAGIEVATLGNHEFNFGIDFLKKAMAGATFPFVSANILAVRDTVSQSGTTFVSPFVILNRCVLDDAGNRQTLRIGVIGFAPPQLVEWDSSLLSGHIETVDIRAAARAQLPRMRTEGADIVVALCHSGFGQLTPVEGAENAALGLAAEGGLDALFAGHTHLVFPSADYPEQEGLDPVSGTAAKVPAAMAGANGSHLGVIDLWLNRSKTGWSVSRSAASVRAITQANERGESVGRVGCDPAVKAGSLAAHAATLEYTQRPIGRLSKPVSSYFATVAPCPCAALIAEAQKWYVSEHLRTIDHLELPLLSAAATFRTGGRSGPSAFTDIPSGPITWRHAADLYPFPNRLCVLRITGAEVLGWLERAAGVFRRIQKGDSDSPLLERRFAPHNFDQILGVSYQIDLSEPALFHPDGVRTAYFKGRIRNLRHNGKIIQPEQEFLIVANDYRAGGGGQFPGTGADKVVHSAPVLNRDVLIDYIRSGSADDFENRLDWSFFPISDASACFETSPKSISALDRMSSLKPKLLAKSASDTETVRISFG